MAAVAALGATHQGTAQAQTPDPDFWKQTAERRDTVHRLVYSQSPQSIPAGYDAVSEAEEVLRQEQRTSPQGNPKTKSLWQQIRTTTVRSALSSPMRAVGTIGLGIGTFELGWKIGTGLNAKFLRIGLPEPQPYTGGYPGLGYRLQYHSGGKVYSNILSVPEGWLVRWTDTDPLTSDGYGFSSSSEKCSGPPPGFGVAIGHDPSYGQWTCRWMQTDPVNNQFHVVIPGEESLAALAAIEDYVDQPFDRSTTAPTPPSQSTVEQNIETEVERAENELLRQWLNYRLGSPGEEDPLEIDPPNPEIEFPGFVTHWQDHGEEFTTPYEDPLEYWRDAADIVERSDNNEDGYFKCFRASDGATIYWSDDKQAIVIVKDGKIVTYFPPDQGYQYFLSQCS
jgi:hypothetical protein